MWSGFSGHSQASPGSGRHGLGWVSLLRARLLELGSAGLRFRPALRKRACLRGAPRAVPPSRVLLPSARAALVKSRDMHWSLLAQRGQRDVSLSSLRMLLVADGANPCESARPSRRHALWGCEHGGRDQSSVTCNRALVTRVLATEFESGFNTVERRHVPESRLFLRNAPVCVLTRSLQPHSGLLGSPTSHTPFLWRELPRLRPLSRRCGVSWGRLGDIRAFL